MARWLPVLAKGCKERAGEAESLSADLRLLLLVMANARAGLHSHFGPDGPQLVKDVGTGELYGKPYLRKLIRKGIEAGLYGEQSTIRCIVLRGEMAEWRQKYPATVCPEHKHNKTSFGGGEWADLSPDVTRNDPFRKAS